MAVSTVPLPSAFFHPLLRALAAHPDGVKKREIAETVADLMDLSPSQRAERVPSGTLRYRHRMGWSYNMLKTAGYVESLAIGIWRPADRGRELLQAHPASLDDETVHRIIRESKVGRPSAPEEPQHSVSEPEETPEERIDAAYRELHDAVAADLLERIGRCSPTFFEHLVLDLLRALDYGRVPEDAAHVGKTGASTASSRSTTWGSRRSTSRRSVGRVPSGARRFKPSAARSWETGLARGSSSRLRRSRRRQGATVNRSPTASSSSTGSASPRS